MSDIITIASGSSWDEAEAELKRLHDILEATTDDEDAVEAAAGDYYDHRIEMIERSPATVSEALRQIELAMFSGEAVLSGVNIFRLIRQAKALAGGAA
jgi:hypothetical protein